MSQLLLHQPRSEPPAPGRALPPGWRRWAPHAAVGWAVAYGSLRAYWAVTGAPSSGRLDSDLVLFAGWSAVALCAAAAAVVLVMDRARWSVPVAVAGWGITVALASASAVVLLDVVGLLLPGLGVEVSVVAFVSRVVCLTGAVLVASSVLTYQRRGRGACLACGATSATVRPTEPPRWAVAAAWAAVGGWLVRVLAQAAVGFGDLAGAIGTLLVFEVGFMLAGTVLPLALTHRWGRVFPRWVPLLAGRRVPRWLVLGPGLALGAGMTAYFGFTLALLAAGTVTGSWDGDGLPLWFFWVAVPGYLVWGLGLGVAALSYRRLTRRPCRVCGR